MKLIIFLLIIAFSYSTPILGGYQPISIQEVQDNKQINSFIQEGLQLIIKEGTEKGELTSSDFTLSQINSVSLQILEEQNYKFDCEFQDSQGVTIQANFEVTFNAFSKVSIVASYSYKVISENVNESVQDSYFEIDTSEIEHSVEIQKVINFGVEQVCKQASWEGKVEGATYQVSNILSVKRQVSGSAIFYKCDVEFFAEQRFIEARFTVYYQPQQDVCALIDYSLPNEDVENVVNTETMVTEEILASVEDNFVQVDTEQAEQNTVVFDCLNYGVQQITEIGLSKGQLSEAGLSITSITKIETQIAGNGVFYKFNCQLLSKQSQIIIATFTVYYVISTNQQSLASYSVQVQSSEGMTSYSSDNNTPTETEYSMEDISVSYEEDTEDTIGMIPEEDYGNEPIIIIEEQVAEETDDTAVDWVDYNSINIALEIQQTTEIETEVFQESTTSDSETIIIVDEPEEEDNYEMMYPEEHPPMVETPISYTDYVIISQAEIQSSQAIQAMLAYATNQVYELGVEQGKIQESYFTITSVESVERKGTKNGVSYKCQVTMNDNDGWTLRMNFTISYNTGTGKYFMNSYKYVISKGVPSTGNGNGQTPTTDYEAVSQSDIQNDQDIQAMLAYASNLVYELGVQQGKINVSVFKITSIQSLYKKITSNGASYKCELTMNDDKSWTLKMNFTISYNSQTGKYFMSYYKYVISSFPSDSYNGQPAEYTQVSQSEIETSQIIQEMLDYATNRVYELGVQQGKIPLSKFVITAMQSVLRKMTNSGTSYKCQVTLNDDSGWTLKMNFTISQSSSGSYFLWSYKYVVSKGYDNNNNNNNNNGDSYQNLDQSQIQNNQEVQQGIGFGVNVVIQNGVNKGKIPSSQYQVTKIVSVSQKIQSSGTYYRCNVELKNAGGVIVKMRFTVFYKISTQTFALSAYSFNVSNIPVTKPPPAKPSTQENEQYTVVQQSEFESSIEIQSSVNFVVEQVIENRAEYKSVKINKCERRVVNSAFYYKLDITLSTETGKNTNLNCIVKDQVNIGVKLVIAYSYKVSYQSTTTTNSTTSSSGFYPGSGSSFTPTSSVSYSYFKVDISTFKSSANYQDVLELGVERCLRKLIDKNFIAGVKFIISQIKSVYKQDTITEENYQLQVRVTNIAGISLDLSLCIRYDKITSQTFLLSFSVQGFASTQTNALVADYVDNDGGQIDVSTCEQVPTSNQETDTKVQEIAQYGASEVGKIVTQQNINISAESSFQVSKIEGVYQDVVNTNTYRVVATITSSIGVNIYASFSVKYEQEVKQLNSCSYFIY